MIVTVSRCSCTGSAVAAVVSAVLKYPQNRNSGGLSFPQLGHLITSRV